MRRVALVSPPIIRIAAAVSVSATWSSSQMPKIRATCDIRFASSAPASVYRKMSPTALMPPR